MVDLKALTTTVGVVSFHVTDLDSRIDLSAMTAFAGGGGSSGLYANRDGTLVTPKLELVEGGYLRLHKGAVMDIDNITRLERVSLEIAGIEPQFAALTSIDEVSIRVSEGGRLALPQFTQVRHSSQNYTVLGMGSI